ncbi:restriction endonuclease subunit S [Luteolibacter sp. AS25]|uniref:restriction endonuclease subunit S n=1 Tax=Luteolibacter sp. AS25 TaxID=3135776 RepID=UPI00398A6473
MSNANVKLDEVVTLYDSLHKTPPGYKDEGYPMIRVTDIRRGFVDTNGTKRVDYETFREFSKKHRPTVGDILFTRVGSYGNSCFVNRDEEICLGQNTVCITPAQKRLDPYYLYCCLNSEVVSAQIESFVGGASQPTISLRNIKEIEIPLPDLPTQRKIAGILSAYDDLIENNLRRIKILEQMAQSLYREWFVHFRFPGHESATFKGSELGRIPEGWEVKKLGELADQMRRGVSKGKLDEVTRYVGLEHIPRQSLALDAWEEVIELGSNKLLFERGDVLFGKIRPYFHKVVVAPFDGVCSADTIIIRAKKPDHRALVTFCVFTEAFVAHATATSNGSKMPRTDWKVLKDYPLVLPPKDLLARFSTLSETAIDQQQNLVKRNQTLRHSRDLILPKLLNQK